MIQVRFKNLEKSELAKEVVLERVGAVVSKFPDLLRTRVIVTLEMENSPLQAGPDLFKVKFHVVGGRFKGITLEKSSSNLYAALADVVEHALERLNRFGDRNRVKIRRKARNALARRDAGAW